MFGITKKIKIGRLESINIINLGLSGITAKIDSGAYRGSIHSTDIREEEENGRKVLKFKIFDENHPEYEDKTYSFDDYKVSKFRGTEVDYHDRYVIPVTLEISGRKIEAELSLADRKDLRYPVLLGRRALKKQFLIDVDQKNI